MPLILSCFKLGKGCRKAASFRCVARCISGSWHLVCSPLKIWQVDGTAYGYSGTRKPFDKGKKHVELHSSTGRGLHRGFHPVNWGTDLRLIPASSRCRSISEHAAHAADLTEPAGMLGALRPNLCISLRGAYMGCSSKTLCGARIVIYNCCCVYP
eukprot:5341437-Pyramimonas_sp.AAC.2